MENDIGYLIKQIDLSLLKAVNRELEAFGLTFSQLRVLVLLRQREQARLMTSFKDIELHFGTSHTTVLGLLRRLEAKRFIRTEIGQADRRVRNVHLSEVDPTFWERLDANKRLTEKRILSGFSNEEVATFQTFLKKVIRNLG